MTPDWRELSSARRTHWPAVKGALPREQVQRALQGHLLLIVAPAGYGKTTALAAGLPETGVPATWLTLDADDADPQVLAAGLALAASALPGGYALGTLLDQEASPARVAARMADVLHDNRAWLILDEAHYLTAPLLTGMLRELLDCGQGHVALLSRVPLHLPELVPLEAAGLLTTLGAAELSFTPDELGRLFQLHGLFPSPAEVQQAHALTEGWPIAARYLAQASAQGRVQLRDLRDLDGGEVQLGTLFTYLAQEVLGPLEPALRSLLTRSSVFEELTPELLGTVLNEPNAAALLEALSSSGTFLTKAGPELYRAHPLLRAHLRSLLPPQEARNISARGAAFFARTGRYRRALAALLNAGKQAEAAALLEEHGQEWLALGRVTLVERSLHRLEPGVWTPPLHALAGDTLRLSSRYDEALRAYAQAGMYASLLGRVQVALDTVQPDLAWEALEHAEALATPQQAPELRRLRAENLLNAGRLPEAIALEPDLAGGTRYALRSGAVQRALELAVQAAAGEAGGPRAAQNHREGLLLASFLHSLLGNAEEAVRFAREGSREGERLASPFVQALALARLGHALLVAQQEPEAAQAYAQALDAARGVSGRLQVEALMGMMTIKARQGEWTQAAELYQQALAQTGGDAYMAGLLHLRSALNAVQQGQAPDPQILQAATQAFLTCGDHLGLTATSLAHVAAHPEAEIPAEVAAGVARFPFLLGRLSLFSPYLKRAQRAQVLARLAAQHPAQASVWQTTAQHLGYPDTPTPTDAPGFEVRVRVLGRVNVSGEDGQARDWGRARARDLLQLLVVHPEGIPRLSAQEALFPDAEPGIGERNFRVTLHALAQVLEQGAQSGTFLERGDWLRLRPSPDLRVDEWQARQALSAPSGSVGRLQTLLNLPPTLADSDLPEVQEAATRYAQALPQALADEAETAWQQGRLKEAQEAAERCLTLDPAHEPAARTLMLVHQRSGNAAAIHRVYQQLEGALRSLELSPMRETTLLYQNLRLTT